MAHLRTANIRGEYWLTEDGPLYADGDTGDDNHEMLAESHMLNQLGYDIGSDHWGTQTYQSALDAFHEALIDPRHGGQVDEYRQELRDAHGDDWWDQGDFHDYLRWLNVQGMEDGPQRARREEWVARELQGMKNPREHVAKHYDWVRVQGNNIEVWEMNDLVRTRLRRQIERIAEEEDWYDEDEEWKERPMFNLSVLSTGKYTPKLTYYDLVDAGLEKKVRENEFEPFPDWRSTKRVPTKVPGYQYDGG